MRKPTLLLGLAIMAMVLASPAAATPPTHTTSPFSGSALFPDATAVPPNPALCDFTYLLVFSGTDEITIFSDGRAEVHEKVKVTHKNLDTGYTLTETDQVNLTFHPDGSSKQVGVFWHLRDANGKLVVVKAGQMVFDATNNAVKFTPHTNPDFAAVICSALRGHPAP